MKILEIRVKLVESVIVAGLAYPAYNFNKQLNKYLSYPSSVKPIKDLENQGTNISFPKVTLCANGIHSMQHIHEFYDWLPHSWSEQIYDGDKARHREHQETHETSDTRREVLTGTVLLSRVSAVESFRMCTLI